MTTKGKKVKAVVEATEPKKIDTAGEALLPSQINSHVLVKRLRGLDGEGDTYVVLKEGLGKNKNIHIAIKLAGSAMSDMSVALSLTVRVAFDARFNAAAYASDWYDTNELIGILPDVSDWANNGDGRVSSYIRGFMNFPVGCTGLPPLGDESPAKHLMGILTSKFGLQFEEQEEEVLIDSLNGDIMKFCTMFTSEKMPDLLVSLMKHKQAKYGDKNEKPYQFKDHKLMILSGNEHVEEVLLEGANVLSQSVPKSATLQ